MPMAASLVMSIGRLHSLIAAFLLCVGETTFAWGQFLAPDKWKSYGAVYRLGMQQPLRGERAEPAM